MVDYFRNGYWLCTMMSQSIKERFRSSGYTLTSQRRAVLEALEESGGHPSAEEVYLLVKRRNPRVALGTVYQALSVLEEIGVVESKHWSDSPVRYDLNTEPHLDIKCVKCGAVAEVEGADIGDLHSRIQEATPYRVTSARIVLEGLCPACQIAD